MSCIAKNSSGIEKTEVIDGRNGMEPGIAKKSIKIPKDLSPKFEKISSIDIVVLVVSITIFLRTSDVLSSGITLVATISVGILSKNFLLLAKFNQLSL